MSAALTIPRQTPPAPRLRQVVRPGASAETRTTQEALVGSRLTIEALETMARERPAALVRLAASDQLDAVDLSEVAEAMGLAPSPEFVVPTLLHLTHHTRPFVRESALVGLASFLRGSLDARDRLREMAATESSEGVRAVAQQFLAQL